VTDTEEKTEVMASENSALDHRNKILYTYKIENSYFKFYTVLTVFLFK